MSHRFLQLHLLTTYGPSNLNRDDLGVPKSVVFGNAPRLRVSSQSLKRSWRTSDLFTAALAGHLGMRTKQIGKLAKDELEKQGVDAKSAFEWSKLIARAFGKLKTDGGDAPTEAAEDGAKRGKSKGKGDSNEVETLVFLSSEEQDGILRLAHELAQRKSGPTAAELKLLRKSNATADLALFGRMLTADKSNPESSDRPGYSVEAAAQIAHAVTVHRATAEDDFFSAVDDLNRDEDTGSGHLGELGFGAGVFYLYACVDRELLVRNLGGDAALAARTLRALCECMTSVAPTGKQKSFASNARASFGLAELSNEPPRQLIAAFLRPVAAAGDHDVAELAVARLGELVARFDAVYGFEGARLHFNATGADGTALDRGVEPDGRPRIRQFVDFTASGLE